MPIVLRRWVTVALSLCVVSGCADEQAATPRPVEERSATTRAATTTVVAPPSTKPLVTAPPSPLLDEVVAAYDAAYADLLAAEAIPDENYPALGNHIGGEQLAVIQDLLVRLRESGQIGRSDPSRASWRRVERVTQGPDGSVQLEVCRFDPTEAVDSEGRIVDPATRPFRHLETLQHQQGAWKWIGRDWLDDAPSSDCALP